MNVLRKVMVQGFSVLVGVLLSVRLAVVLRRREDMREWLLTSVINTCPHAITEVTFEELKDPVVVNTIQVNALCLAHLAPVLFGEQVVPESWTWLNRQVEMCFKEVMGTYERGGIHA